MLRLFRFNSVLLKYNNEVYKYVVLYKLSIIQCFLDEEYVIVEEETNEKNETSFNTYFRYIVTPIENISYNYFSIIKEIKKDYRN